MYSACSTEIIIPNIYWTQGEVLDMELLKQDLAALVQKVDSLVERL